jgi:hypothetical protein
MLVMLFTCSLSFGHSDVTIDGYYQLMLAVGNDGYVNVCIYFYICIDGYYICIDGYY